MEILHVAMGQHDMQLVTIVHVVKVGCNLQTLAGSWYLKVAHSIKMPSTEQKPQGLQMENAVATGGDGAA